MTGFEKTGELLSALSDIGRTKIMRMDSGKWHPESGCGKMTVKGMET